MRRIGFGAQGVVRFGASASQDDQPLAELEELAMPLFDSLYNFAHWLAHNSKRRRGSRPKDLLQGFARLLIVSAWQQFSGVDISNPEEHVSEFLFNTGSAYDRRDRLRGGRT